MLVAHGLGLLDSSAVILFFQLSLHFLPKDAAKVDDLMQKARF